ncbi:normal mucosa of esophagus-specific gene 1 protein-like [Amphiura filiformis]|uniref:normal mucosa of esophagus-specific gene 1 protein-like n=1 Tax=Amphiura filiformis TaxID=82378 RepID=UPI003B21B21A
MAFGPTGLLGRINRRNYDLLPLVGIMGTVCCLAFGFVGYSIVKKSDVAVMRRRNPHPWQKIDPSEPQKLISLNQKWESTPAVEKLRKDIGA